MKRAMRQSRRQVMDPELICAMLDQMDTICVGIHDDPAPYVVPLNFGYVFEEGNFVFYFHCARTGHKLDLLRQNPHVCVTASRFISYAKGSVKGHMHDYQSVIARGVAQEIDQDLQPEAFKKALETLLIHNHRNASEADTPAAKWIQMWKIVCREEDVTAKAEIMPHSADEVDFAPPIADGIPLDESHILDM